MDQLPHLNSMLVTALLLEVTAPAFIAMIAQTNRFDIDNIIMI